ncbi:MAG: excisionase family DNA-binding protein [Abditibacteriota bacterium]|nr:excisionase family DNA-binding protein [Abditibacteriota bacterium]
MALRKCGKRIRHTETPLRLEDLPDICTVELAAQYLGISRASGYRQVQARQIPFHRVGHRILIPKARLKLWIEGWPDSGAACTHEE